jgi:hypothetical protein
MSFSTAPTFGACLSTTEASTCRSSGPEQQQHEQHDKRFFLDHLRMTAAAESTTTHGLSACPSPRGDVQDFCFNPNRAKWMKETTATRLRANTFIEVTIP